MHKILFFGFFLYKTLYAQMLGELSASHKAVQLAVCDVCPLIGSNLGFGAGEVKKQKLSTDLKQRFAENMHFIIVSIAVWNQSELM